MTKDIDTITVYDQKADEYAKFTCGSEADPILMRFLDRLDPGSAILDFGCGPGHHAAVMHDHGFAVTAIDASTNMVAIAEQHAGVAVLQASFDDFEDRKAYHGIWANFSLLHATRKQFPGLLVNLSHALKDNGILHLGMKTGTSEGRDKIGRHYAYYSAVELTQFLNSAGFDILDETKGESPGLAGEIEPWVVLTAKLKSPRSDI